MATRLATGVYQLTPAEGLTLQLSAVGTLFTVVGTIGEKDIQFPESGDVVKLTPEILGGAGMHIVNLRCFFNNGSTPQAQYEVLVIDDDGSQLDDIRIPIVTTQTLPYQALTQLAVIVPAATVPAPAVPAANVPAPVVPAANVPVANVPVAKVPSGGAQ
jgi:hypothetical protein